MSFYHLTAISANKKTGPMPVTISSKDTCPDACPLKEKNLCYAFDHPLNIHWSRVTEEKMGSSLEDFCDKISKLPRGILWRHNQAGDLPGKGDDIDRSALTAITTANKKARAKGFTFTHKPVGWDTLQEINNATAVTDANLNGFTINLSGNNLEHADKLYSFGIGPVVAIVGLDVPRHGKTPAGRHYSVCPAQERDDITCNNCRLCSIPNRKVIIAFRAHGKSQKRVLNVIQN